MVIRGMRHAPRTWAAKVNPRGKPDGGGGHRVRTRARGYHLRSDALAGAELPPPAGRALASSLGSDPPRPLPRHARRLRLFSDRQQPPGRARRRGLGDRDRRDARGAGARRRRRQRFGGDAPRGARALASGGRAPERPHAPHRQRRRRDPRGSSAGKPRTAPVERNLGRGSAAHAFRRPRRRHGDPARKRCSGACDRARTAGLAGPDRRRPSDGATALRLAHADAQRGLAAVRGGVRDHRAWRRLLASGEPRAGRRRRV